MNEIFVDVQRIYWDQLDLLGVLHNAAYPALFERARTAFWRSLGIDGYQDKDLDFPYYVVRNEINYLMPLTSEQEIRVRVFVEKIGRTSLTFGHDIFDNAHNQVSVGSTTIVRIDPETKAPIPWSDNMRRMLAPYVKSI